MPTAVASNISRNALVVLAVIAAGCMFYVLADILTPLALAMFLAVMIDGFARVLKNSVPWVSDRVAIPLAVALSAVLFGGTAWFIAENAAAFGQQLIAYQPRLNGLIARVAGVVGMEAPPTLNQLVHQIDYGKYAGMAAKSAQSFVATAAFVLVYLGFIIASRRGWERKLVGLFPVRSARQDALAAFLRIRDGVERYLWVQTVTGVMIAGGSWIAMAAVGLDNAIFWAFLIFIASYIPVVGSIVGVAAPPLFALLQYDTLWQAIVLFSVLQTITLVVGNIIYPRMQGRSLNIDPVMVLLALAFWGAIWGLTGAFLSTPLTVAMMVVLAQFDGTRWIAIILSEDGDPGHMKDRKPSPSPVERVEVDEKPAAHPVGRKAAATASRTTPATPPAVKGRGKK